MGEDRGPEACGGDAAGVEDIAGGLVRDLEDGGMGTFDGDFREVRGGSAAFGVHGDRVWPAGELLIAEAGPAFEGDGLSGFVEAGEAVAIGALFFVIDVCRVGVGDHGEAVAEAVAVIACPWEGAAGDGMGAGLMIGWFPPSAVDGVDEGGAGEGEGSVAPRLDAVPDEDREVLIAAEVDRSGAPEVGEGTVPLGLGPAIAVEVGEESFPGFSMEVDRAAEGRLGEHAFRYGGFPVIGPGCEEAVLAVAEQGEAGKVDGGRVP